MVWSARPSSPVVGELTMAVRSPGVHDARAPGHPVLCAARGVVGSGNLGQTSSGSARRLVRWRSTEHQAKSDAIRVEVPSVANRPYLSVSHSRMASGAWAHTHLGHGRAGARVRAGRPLSGRTGAAARAPDGLRPSRWNTGCDCSACSPITPRTRPILATFSAPSTRHKWLLPLRRWPCGGFPLRRGSRRPDW